MSQSALFLMQALRAQQPWDSFLYRLWDNAIAHCLGMTAYFPSVFEEAP